MDENTQNSFDEFHKHVYSIVEAAGDPEKKLKILQTFSKMNNLPEGALEWLEETRAQVVENYDTDGTLELSERLFKSIKDSKEREEIDAADRELMNDPEAFWRHFKNRDGFNK